MERVQAKNGVADREDGELKVVKLLEVEGMLACPDKQAVCLLPETSAFDNGSLQNNHCYRQWRQQRYISSYVRKY